MEELLHKLGGDGGDVLQVLEHGVDLALLFEVHCDGSANLGFLGVVHTLDSTNGLVLSGVLGVDGGDGTVLCSVLAAQVGDGGVLSAVDRLQVADASVLGGVGIAKGREVAALGAVYAFDGCKARVLLGIVASHLAEVAVLLGVLAVNGVDPRLKSIHLFSKGGIFVLEVAHLAGQAMVDVALGLHVGFHLLCGGVEVPHLIVSGTRFPGDQAGVVVNGVDLVVAETEPVTHVSLVAVEC